MKYHQCQASGCTIQIPEAQLLCAGHLKRVPYALRNKLILAQRRRKNGDRKSETLYCCTCRDALQSIQDAKTK